MFLFSIEWIILFHRLLTHLQPVHSSSFLILFFLFLLYLAGMEQIAILQNRLIGMIARGTAALQITRGSCLLLLFCACMLGHQESCGLHSLSLQNKIILTRSGLGWGPNIASVPFYPAYTPLINFIFLILMDARNHVVLKCDNRH